MSSAEAAPVIYVETIQDVLDSPFERDLVRMRLLQDGSLLIDDDDATLIAEHGISTNFGFVAFLPISFSHIFIDLPPVDHFLVGSLSLTVFDADAGVISGGANDPITVEGTIVGLLTPGDNVWTVTSLFTTDDLLIDLVLADHFLDVTVTPFIEFDGLQLLSSTMVVQYEPLVLVPEPSSAALGLTAIGLLALSRRRRRVRR